MNEEEFRECVLDFQSGLQQFRNFYNHNPEHPLIPYEEFRTWFVENVEWFYHGNELTADEYKAKGEYVAGNCFGNAVTIALTDESYFYYEGFVHVRSRPNDVVRHGFNVKDNQVKDFTYFGEAVVEPIFYCGVRIPLDVVERGIELHFGALAEYKRLKRQKSFLLPLFGTETNRLGLINGEHFYHPDFGG